MPEMENEHPLTTYRRSKALTLEAFAKLAGVNKTTVLRWEEGKPPSVRRIKQLVELCDGDLSEVELLKAVDPNWPARNSGRTKDVQRRPVA